MKKQLTKFFSLLLILAMSFCLITLGALPAMADSESEMPDTYPYDTTLWVGVEAYFSNTWYFNEAGYKVTSVTSSDKSVIKVKRWKEDSKTNIESYWLLPKKPGKATITVKYKTKTGKAKSLKLTRTVKPFPKVFKSLKVNGKTVDLSEYKTYYDAKYTKTSPKVKLELNGDWQITQKYGYLIKHKKNGDFLKEKNFNIPARKTLYEGKALKFPKTWDDFGITITLENDDGEVYEYHINLYRKSY